MSAAGNRMSDFLYLYIPQNWLIINSLFTQHPTNNLKEVENTGLMISIRAFDYPESKRVTTSVIKGWNVYENYIRFC